MVVGEAFPAVVEMLYMWLQPSKVCLGREEGGAWKVRYWRRKWRPDYEGSPTACCKVLLHREWETSEWNLIEWCHCRISILAGFQGEQNKMQKRAGEQVPRSVSWASKLPCKLLVRDGHHQEAEKSRERGWEGTRLWATGCEFRRSWMGEFSAIIKPRGRRSIACKSRIWVNNGIADGKKWIQG